MVVVNVTWGRKGDDATLESKWSRDGAQRHQLNNIFAAHVPPCKMGEQRRRSKNPINQKSQNSQVMIWFYKNDVDITLRGVPPKCSKKSHTLKKATRLKKSHTLKKKNHAFHLFVQLLMSECVSVCVCVESVCVCRECSWTKIYVIFH